MLKQNFFKLLNHELKNLSPHAKLVQLKIIKDYLDEYTDNIMKSFASCPICKKYSLKKNFIHYIEDKTECYIGKDYIGDVTYLYSKCPLCDQTSKKVLSTRNLIRYDFRVGFWVP